MHNLAIKLSQLGELGLIEFITEFLIKSRTGEFRREISVDVGDDAAAWRSPGLPELGTTDILIGLAGANVLARELPPAT